MAAYDWLIVLGGPMNVDDEDKHPWLRAEKQFIGAWLKAEKPYLGICLGGQLLAQALGGSVTKNEQREIGFHAVERTGKDHPALRRWPQDFTVFQWHEDRFSLPEGCKSLLTSPACEHQAFAKDERTFGFQFHPESTAEWIHGNYAGFTPREGEAYVQDQAACDALLPAKLDPMTKQFFLFLDDFAQGAR